MMTIDFVDPCIHRISFTVLCVPDGRRHPKCPAQVFYCGCMNPRNARVGDAKDTADLPLRSFFEVKEPNDNAFSFGELLDSFFNFLAKFTAKTTE